ncbi:ribosome biogenesis GTPase Der [Bryobacter aggregatus]|uniref:ribosome biogenesis GTPase Der n=1 Tax=Bryobacter aggregatus TaxID=360054 RepID=UPI0004E11D24|nr:ribosome biogenesis GTPase Der [Bryobacter aggregatus]
MAHSAGKPVVVIVGRPNVGKSTLFNAITGTRRSIVGDEPGITRDRIRGSAKYRDRHFDVIDTGGIIPNDDELIPANILKQAKKAFEEATQIVFVIDGRTEITSSDRELAQMLRRLGKPITLAVNKIDVPKREVLSSGFHDLGLDPVISISAEHRTGIDDLLDHITADFPESESPEETVKPARPIKVAIIGRPNVGKSTLLNSLTGTERAIVSPVAGTTRDAVDETVTVDGQEFIFVDTAGIRRKGKTTLMAEKLSVMMARRHIGMAHIIIVMIDALEGPTAQDAHIAGYAHEEGRPVILCVNKWDAHPTRRTKEFTEEVRDTMKFLEYAPIEFISATKGTNVKRLFHLIQSAQEAMNKRVTTGELNRFVEQITRETNMKVKYITQASVRPPSFVVFTDKSKPLHFSDERFLINQIRKHFHFGATPIEIKAKSTPGRGKKA